MADGSVKAKGLFGYAPSAVNLTPFMGTSKSRTLEIRQTLLKTVEASESLLPRGIRTEPQDKHLYSQIS